MVIQRVWKWVGAGAIVLSAALMIVLGCQPKTGPGRLNLVIIFIDTLRADHLGCYGYHRRTSPNMDRLAGRGTLFENAIAQSSWTLPSAASLLTGLYPTRHQAIHKNARLPDRRETLAEVLKAHGYSTGAVVSHNFVSSLHNMQQGFDEFGESRSGGHLSISSPTVTDLGLRWLRESMNPPFFLFLHYFDPHYSYMKHPGFEFGEEYRGSMNPQGKFGVIRNMREKLRVEDLTHLRDLYDGEIAFTDHYVGRVLEELNTLELDGSTIVVVTGDHGEEFMEHGWLGHTTHLYEETVRVPLVLYNPAMSGLPDRVGRPVELIDIMPTLLEMLGITWNGETLDGASLVAGLREGVAQDTVAFSEVCFRDVLSREKPGDEREDEPNLRSVRAGHWKLIHDVGRRSWEMYDLKEDPGEIVNLAAGAPPQHFRDIQQRLLDWMAEQEERAVAENRTLDRIGSMDAETEETLRSLGYVQ